MMINKALKTLLVASLIFAHASVQADAVKESYDTSNWKYWMPVDVLIAWKNNYSGYKTNVTTVDLFSDYELNGDLTGQGARTESHGYWTSEMIRMMAPHARVFEHDIVNNTGNLRLHRGLDVINLSISSIGKWDEFGDIRKVDWSDKEKHLFRLANSKRVYAPVIVKAAGNRGIPVLEKDRLGQVDWYNLALAGKRNVIFAGAMERKLGVGSKTSYSEYPGDNKMVQNQFLLVDVGRLTSQTGLTGTSFAAPVISSYAAILGSKFKGAKAKHIVRRLLDTAMTGSIENYDPRLHGRGEASILSSIAPSSIQ